ncbi:recombinase family protein [Armatimonas sp.]|uniref:recombinase family protein n=1 Tax=Armatimonas sp. TaxID=1872638 RepID=UPI00286B72CD|nr:recombinase family protein [Armatimonas sp.]
MSTSPLRVGLYARVSTQDQQTLPLQREAMEQYAATRGWTIVETVEEIASGASTRPLREQLLKAAKRRELDVLLVWRLDRWGRSLPDLFNTLHELTALGVGFVSLTEAMDLTTPMGRAMAAMLAVFAEFEREVLRERVKAGIAQSRSKGKPHGRPQTALRRQDEVVALHQQGLNQAQIARQLQIGRSSVRRILVATGLLTEAKAKRVVSE